jgi:NAD(P)H-dependent flavin oxidoreductase YrpB (nitropropane dioxygenase family)
VWSCGQSIGLIDAVVPCVELVQSIVDEAASIIQQRLNTLLVLPKPKL